MLEQFIIISLGLWRIVSLLANEVGPFELFQDIRKRVEWLDNRFATLHEFRLYEGYTCEWCLGFWLALPSLLAWQYLGEEFVWLMAVPALSTVVIMLKYIVQTLEQVQSYVVKLNTVEKPASDTDVDSIWDRR